MTYTLMLALALSACLGQARAADPEPAGAAAAAGETVQVTLLRDPDFKSYTAFAQGLDTFEEKRSLAPQAPLLFRLVPSIPAAPMGGVTMRIASDTTSIQVPVNPDGTFSMPRSQAAIDENAGIFLNKKRGSYRWRPYFNTPNLPPNTRRLGDLRLECEVRWAVEHSGPAPSQRDGAAACHSRYVQVLNLAPRPLLGYTMVSGERRQKFVAPRAERQAPAVLYSVPLHDSSWPDDTLIEFVYAPQA